MTPQKPVYKSWHQNEKGLTRTTYGHLWLVTITNTHPENFVVQRENTTNYCLNSIKKKERDDFLKNKMYQLLKAEKYQDIIR